MLKKMNIGSKITAIALALVTLAVAIISFIAHGLVKNAIEQQHATSLATITEHKKSRIVDYFDRTESTMVAIAEAVANDSIGQVATNDLAIELEEESANVLPLAPRDQAVLELLKHDAYLHHICVVTPSGRITYTTVGAEKLAGSSFYDPEGQIIKNAREGIYYSGVQEKKGAKFIYVGAPIPNRSEVLLARVSVEPVLRVINDSTGLGTTGETVVARSFKDKVVFLNKLRHTTEQVLLDNSHRAGPMQRALKATNGVGKDTDYRNQEVVASWAYIPKLQWGIVTKMDTEEIQAQLDSLLWRFLIAGIIVFVLTLIAGTVFSRFLIRSLLRLRDALTMLGQGVLPDHVDKSSEGEVGEMEEATDRLVQALQRTAHFAHEIGEGAYSSEFSPQSDQDTLGNALINMRDSIQNAEKRDTERNWIVTGVAEVGEILRSHNELTALGDEVVAYVSNKINAIQGAFYVVDEEQDKEPVISMKASYAYNKQKHLKAQFRMAEGLVGQAAIEQDTLVRTEIPYDYVTITSGLLGDQRPESLMIVPLITNEQVYGVLEFASFEKFTSRDIKFVEEISLITARTVFNIKVNERTRRLLGESQQMSNELQEQQEVLRQNAEEMQATQEELQRTNKQLADQVQEVERTQNRMASLLVNASEVITIYEADGGIRYISPSVERIFGYHPDEMIGQSDLQYIQGEGIKVFSSMFTTLIGNPRESVTVQYIYETKSAGEVWVEATGTNLIDDPAVNGIIINSRDITERRRAEQEERMRSKMQALSENSPDLITRMDREGTFFYINPTIETYTGKTPSHFLSKNLEESGLSDAIVEEWKKVLYEVGATKHKVSREIDFPSEKGDRVMNLNAIPEFDEDEKLESVLVVSHDITDRKLIELEIQNKNRKIHDSLNYASRIQDAILPDNKIIKQVFPESFIYYKARDTVSGDFPWFVQTDDEIFIAAVDCTGHGVPGALISLIGYFLLNDIVKSRKITDPGVILDQLDEGVTQTLRQDSDDSKTKDGMDIALCRIKDNEVQYAGAHRPLYFMQQNEMVEIKGDKFPIGGGIYKNQTNFTTHTIEVKKGDGIYFCSDGFPDQFGGPDNRKFGSKRTRALIHEHHHLPIEEVHQNFGNTWETWRADERQTDDVLMIGIKF